MPSTKTATPDRVWGLHASDVAAAIGINPWKSPEGLWLQETGRMDRWSGNDATHLGNLFEDVIRDEYSDEICAAIDEPIKDARHPIFDWLVGTPDGMLCFGKRHIEIIEIKMVGPRTESDWGKPGTDQVPAYYRTQVAAYMEIFNARRTRFRVCFSGQRLAEYIVERDADFFNAILGPAEEFWRCVEEDRPPTPLDEFPEELLNRVWPRSTESVVVATSEIEAKLARLAEINDALATTKALEAERSALTTDIKRFIKDSQAIVTNDGEILATWRSTDREHFDKGALKSEHPEMWARYAKIEPVRTFLPKWKAIKGDDDESY